MKVRPVTVNWLPMYEPFPALTFLVIVVTCVVSYQGFKSADFERKYIFNPHAILVGKEYYRLVTSAFLHANWQHLIFNMMSLYFFGRHLEFYPGNLEFLLIYFGAITGGSLLSLFVHRHHHYTAYGASGGVCGVFFAFILLYPGSGVALFFIPLSIPGWLYAIGYIAYSFFGMKEHRGDVGHDAHLGGAIIGFLIASGMHPTAVLDNLLVFSIVLVAAVLLLAYLWWNPLFLPLSTFFDRPTQWRPKSSSLPTHKREALKVDAILEKIAQKGIHSLTPEEKATLGEVSHKYQRRSDSAKPRSGLSI